jgi:VWFA-related protein
MRAFSLAVLATILGAAVAGPAGAADAVASVPPTVNAFGASIDVRVVNVEAVVTDRKGGRVRGLAAADFRLLVDGHEVPIDYFTEIASGAAAAPAPAAAPATAAKPAAPAAPATIAAPGEAVGTNYLVYIDNQFSIQVRRNLVLQKLAADLGHLGPHDRMALLAFDGHKLTRLSDWTADRKALAAAFAVAEELSTGGLQTVAEERSEGDESQMVEETGPAAISRGWRIGTGMRAVVAAMRGTPTPPGRKVMLFLNGGWGTPELPQPDTGAPSAMNQPEAAKIFAPVFDAANLLGYTLYTVEIPGVLGLARGNDATVMGSANTSIPSSDPNRYVQPPAASLGQNEVLLSPVATSTPEGFITTPYGRSVQANLEVMAQQTGGAAFLNSAWQNAFERVTADTSSYYWLGFTPQWKADGSHHKIELEVRRTGLAVRSRSGFSDLSQATEAQVQAESLLLFGPSQSEHPLGVTAGALRRVSFRLRELPVTIEVPADALVPQVEEGNWSLEGTLSIAILEKGGDPHWRTLPVHFKSNGLPPAGATTSMQTVLKLPRSTRQVIFAIGGEHGEVRAWKLLDLDSIAAPGTGGKG